MYIKLLPQKGSVNKTNSLIITLKMEIPISSIKIKANHIKKAIKHYVRWP